MKRRWRAGRVLIAVLLLSLAAMTFYVWPVRPLWRMPCENVLGYDADLKILFTSPEVPYALDSIPLAGADNSDEATKDALELHGYSVATGRCQISKTFRMDLSHVSRGFRNSLSWIATLSPDRQLFIALEAWHHEIQVFDVATGQLRFRLELSPHSIVKASGFSPDSRFFYACALSPCRLLTWELSSGRLLKTIELPDDLFGPTASPLEPNQIQIDEQNTIAVVGGDVRGLQIVDLKSNRACGMCDSATASRFVQGGTNLIAVERRSNDNGVCWYDLQSGAMIRSSTQTSEPVDGRFIGFGKQSLITAKSLPEPALFIHRWLPESVTRRIAEWLHLGGRTLQITLWNTKSGALQTRFPLRLQGDFTYDFISEVRAFGYDNLLVLNDGYEITIWDIPPRRSATCWLVCSSIAFLSLWLASPRKANMV